jgi:flavin reductase (DIM6/NTAB) family NADH-FMN oxidoreductase RutF
MDYRTTDKQTYPQDVFKSCTVPRPIGWLSTVSRDGVANLAPFSQWQNLTFDPPTVMFAANQTPNGDRKDTVINAEATGWFVWNMATWELREAVAASGRAVPPEVDEFELTGLEKERCVEAPAPRVKASPCHFECRYLQTIRIPGDSPIAAVDLVIGRVEVVHIDDDVIDGNGRLDVLRVRPLARLGYMDYTSVESVFEMRPPEDDDAHVAGFVGRTL